MTAKRAPGARQFPSTTGRAKLPRRNRTAIWGKPHMQAHSLTAIVTLLSLLTYLGLALNVGRVRYKVGIFAPAMTGDPRLERAVRVHYNTLEWLPLFLGSLWLFSLYWSDAVAAALGAAWILGRIVYAAGYMNDPDKRAPGFLIQALATLVLLLGALGRIVYGLASAGA
jgi:uncharacterized membrane protein YecN with MAPEG domain